MNWEIIENLIIAILSVAALAATARVIWFMYELMWAFRCAFRI